MNKYCEIKKLQPPTVLAEGFLHFANEIKQESIDKGVKFSAEELADLFNKSPSGLVRAEFLLWVNDLNRIIDSINLILGDLFELRKNKNAFKGNAITRSEFLLQGFFGEFFRIRETARIFIKYLASIKVISNKRKKEFYDYYFTGFDWVYNIRNSIIHQGVTFKDFDVEMKLEEIPNLSKKEYDRFVKLVKESNTRENTVEIQCAFYSEIIKHTMKRFNEFQNLINNALGELIVSFEKKALFVKIEKKE